MEHPDAETAQARAEIIEELQSRIMDQYNESLWERPWRSFATDTTRRRGRYYGRTYADSPDIDGKVWFTASSPVKTGSFCQVRITGVQDGEAGGAGGNGMTAASKVTLTRIFLIPVYMVLMYVSGGVAGPWMWGALGYSSWPV